MGQIYNGTLITQTNDYDSPTGNYILAPIANPAQSDNVKDGKQGYDSLGNVVVGMNKGGYAGLISSYEEMDSYLTEENVGRILKYIGEEQKGNSVPANPIAVGDILESSAAGDAGHPILYLNTDVTPDFSQFPDEEMAGNEGYALLTLDENGGNTPFVVAQKMSMGTDIAYAIIACETPLYAYSETLDASSAGLSAWGWQVTTPVTIDRWGGVAKVTAVNQQDVWGAYISKDGQWTSGGSAYTTGAIYQVVNDGTAIVFKEIRI